MSFLGPPYITGGKFKKNIDVARLTRGAETSKQNITSKCKKQF